MFTSIIKNNAFAVVVVFVNTLRSCYNCSPIEFVGNILTRVCSVRSLVATLMCTVVDL